MVAKINLLSRLTPLLFVFAPFLAQSNMTVYPMAVSINSQGEGNVRVISKEGANKRGNSSRLTQSFHFFMFEPIFSPVNALNQPI